MQNTNTLFQKNRIPCEGVLQYAPTIVNNFLPKNLVNPTICVNTHTHTHLLNSHPPSLFSFHKIEIAKISNFCKTIFYRTSVVEPLDFARDKLRRNVVGRFFVLPSTPKAYHMNNPEQARSAQLGVCEILSPYPALRRSATSGKCRTPMGCRGEREDASTPSYANAHSGLFTLHTFGVRERLPTTDVPYGRPLRSPLQTTNQKK